MAISESTKAARRISKAEQETIVRWDDETQALDLYTASPRVRDRLLKRGYQLKPDGWGWRGTGWPVSLLSFRRVGPDLRVRRPLSEAQESALVPGRFGSRALKSAESTTPPSEAPALAAQGA